MRELTFNEVEAVSGAEVTSGGLIASAVAGGITGGLAGATAAGVGAIPGALGGAMLGVISYTLYEGIKDLID